MLKLTIPKQELYDEEKNEFTYIDEKTINLEHSLISISKWESIHEKPYLTNDEKTIEERIDYIKCMTLTQNVPDDIYLGLTSENLLTIDNYINSKMSATWFSNTNNRTSREIITSELIYYWMVEYGIPFECQKWHLNRLMTLIRVCSVKKEPPKKMSRNEILARNARLNAARRARLHTRG